MQLSKNSSLAKFYRYLQKQPHVLEMDYDKFERRFRDDYLPHNMCGLFWNLTKYFLFHLPAVIVLASFTLYAFIIAPIDVIYCLFHYGLNQHGLNESSTLFEPSWATIICVLSILLILFLAYIFIKIKKFIPHICAEIDWKD